MGSDAAMGMFHTRGASCGGQLGPRKAVHVAPPMPRKSCAHTKKPAPPALLDEPGGVGAAEAPQADEALSLRLRPTLGRPSFYQ